MYKSAPAPLLSSALAVSPSLVDDPAEATVREESLITSPRGLDRRPFISWEKNTGIASFSTEVEKKLAFAFRMFDNLSN